MTKKYLPHIDGLRAISVLAVILFHLDLKLFSGGYVGVDVFFVISGFLITRIILHSIDSDSGFSLKNFYIRRFKRLGPALITNSIITFAISTLIFTPADLKRISGAMLASLLSFSNIYFWLEADYFDVSTKLKPYMHTWSLSIEEQFYLFWPFFLIFISKKHLKNHRFLIIFILSLLSFLLNHLFHDGNIAVTIAKFSKPISKLFLNGGSTLFFLIPFRVFEFGFGGLLVFLFNKEIKVKYIYDFLLWSGLGLILYSVFTYDDSLIFPYWRAFMPCLGAAMVIFSGHHAFTKIILENRLMVLIGLLSYSLYLTHWPIIVFHHALGASSLSFNSRLLALFFTFITAYLLHNKIEKPFRNIKFRESPRKLKLYLLFSTLLIITLGGHCFFNNGWSWRITDPHAQMIDLKKTNSYHREYYGGEGYPRYSNIKSDIPPDVILVGDSHGRHYAEGIVKVLAKKNGLRIYFATGTSCFHLPGFTRTSNSADFNRLCPDRVKKIKNFVNIKNSKPPTIIMSHSWQSQLKLAGLLNVHSSDSVSIDDLKKGLLDFKKMIGQSKLIIIGEVPGAGLNLYNYYARPKISHFFSKKMDYRFTNPIKEKTSFNLILKELAEQNEGISFIDPHTVFCEESLCRNFDDQGNFIYSDELHLSKFGSIYFIEKMENFLLKIINYNNEQSE